MDNLELVKLNQNLQYGLSLLEEADNDRELLNSGKVRIGEIESKYAGLLCNCDVMSFRETFGSDYLPGNESLFYTDTNYKEGNLFIGKVIKSIWNFIKNIFRKIINYFKRILTGKDGETLDGKDFQHVITTLGRIPGLNDKKLNEIWKEDEDKSVLRDLVLNLYFAGLNSSIGNGIIKYGSVGIESINNLLKAYDLVKETGEYSENKGLLKDLKTANGLVVNINSDNTIDSARFDKGCKDAFSSGQKTITQGSFQNYLPNLRNPNTEKIIKELNAIFNKHGEGDGVNDTSVSSLVSKIRHVAEAPVEFATSLNKLIKNALDISGSDNNGVRPYVTYETLNNTDIELKIDVKSNSNTINHQPLGDEIERLVLGGLLDSSDNMDYIFTIKNKLISRVEISGVVGKFKNGKLSLNLCKVSDLPSFMALPITYTSKTPSEKYITVDGGTVFLYVKKLELDVTRFEDGINSIITNLTVKDISDVINLFAKSIDAYNNNLNNFVSSLSQLEMKIPNGSDSVNAGQIFLSRIRDIASDIGKISSCLSFIEKLTSHIGGKTGTLVKGLVSYCKEKGIDAQELEDFRVKIHHY